MRSILLLAAIFFASVTVNAQILNPVSWTFTSKKIADKIYEVHMTANIQSGWHIYSQTQPDDAIAIPTSVTLNNNPLLTFDGKVKEVGKLEKHTDATVKATNHQYSNKVDFVQTVKLKSSAKTNVTGSVEFQTCDDHKCLPPKSVNFNIALN